MPAAVWNTDAVPPAERTALWRESMHEAFGGLRTEFPGDAVFAGRLVSSELGALPIARLQAGRHRVLREARPRRASDPGHLKILAPFEGEAWVYQHQRKALARPGEWVAYDTNEAYVVDNPAPVDHLVLMVPRQLLEDSALDVRDFMARTLSAHGVSRVALETMRSAQRELPHLLPHLAQNTADMVSELVRLSLLQLRAADSGLMSPRTALRERVLRHVEQRLGDAALSVGRIAADLGCSKRALHEAFHGEEDTLAAHILRRRIEACARDLANPLWRSRPVVEVALGRGFANASHFSRAFRLQMGMSPSEYRRRHAGH